MDYSSYKRTFPNLSVREIERLHQFKTNFPNQTIEWLKIIDKSNDSDPSRARAIDLARIRSAVRYNETNGPKKNYGSNTKKVKQVDRKKLQAEERKLLIPNKQMPTSKLTKTDQKLFRGTAAEVHGFMSNEDILNSIGCNFNVDRRPHKINDREYPEIQIWHRSDNMDALGVFGKRRQCIQPTTFIDYFRQFCDASQKEITLDLVGSFDAGKTFYMASKLTNDQTKFSDVGDKTDSWLVVTDYYGESKSPKVMVLFNELVCTNGMTRQIHQRFNCFSHLREMTFGDVQPVLDAAIKESQEYNRIKDKCIKTPITMDTAKNAIRGFFDDEKAEMLKTRTVEKILSEGLIGGDLESRNGTAWGLVSAMTQYTSHNRTKAADQTDERTFASQLDGSRNYMNKKFLEYLETQMLVTA